MTHQVVSTVSNKIIAFQGVEGAYSHLACQHYYPDYTPFAKASFVDAFRTVEQGEAGLAMIPIENTLGGRVADIHLLLPESDLHIVDEFFMPINHCLMGQKGVSLEDITHVHSHPQGLAQCRKTIDKLGLTPIAQADTAGSAKLISTMNDAHNGAIASSLAADIYGLDILDDDFKDEPDNVTRFIVLSKNPVSYDVKDYEQFVTSVILTTRNIPAVLYKCLGAFATEGVDLMKLESYLPVMGTSASFYVEVNGHKNQDNVARALEEIAYFTENIRIVGVYPQHSFRTCQS